MAKIKLSKKHHDAMNASLRQLADIEPEIARARSAGMDTSEHEQMHRDAMERLMLLKQHYGAAMGQ